MPLPENNSSYYNGAFGIPVYTTEFVFFYTEG